MTIHPPSANRAVASPAMAVLLARFSLQRLPKGYLVATPHARDDRILFLREGQMRVYVANDDKELTLSYLAAGEMFSTHTRAYLSCEQDCELLSMPTREFARNLSDTPGLLGLVMPVLGRLLDSSIALIEDLAFRDVAGRLARFLLSMARRHGRADEGAEAFTLDLPVGEIALLLGSTRQTVSGLLQRLEREGVIARPGRRELRLLRPEVLRAWQEGA
ncbi:Crp/Fnr family transcriptional regulator [Zoogloea dura]|uniref:Crp/Fnr family transcriptional regulator n=1 Tax=Zoogloea dura TaxID=2728840 RepID=A0A848GBX5_9RHOO|nr:Crp/Fnr family transcriptional regulator [Zoogloea dura]NML28890.1 Crp/Fnr family transcriptional regulator [Zoogloea dura]